MRLKLGLGLIITVLGLLGSLIWGCYLTDPYQGSSVVETPFTTTVAGDGAILLEQNFSPTLDLSPLSQLLAYARTGVRIAWYSWRNQEKPLVGSEPEIIRQIHTERFNPDRPYVITGSHYSDLYMRNLGIFFNALLDPRLSADQADWQNRQRIALQTVAYDLAFLAQNKTAVTTIAPTGPHQFTGLNIYSPPSDSLFGIVFTLKALEDAGFIEQRFPIPNPPTRLVLQTELTAQNLLEQHRPILSRALDHYLQDTLDPATGLVRRDISLSSARDGVSRKSSFYDNVIAWATVQLADDLGIPHQPTQDALAWKQNIISTFWNPTLGIFHNDLSGGPMEFSADSLIVTSSGFFDLQDSNDRQKLNRIVQYIQKEKLDQPFPLRYSRTNEANKMHLTVRLFAPSYMGDGIWSHWGMEYIKVLSLLASDHPEHALQARNFLDIYRQNIEKTRGYPELYGPDGNQFNSGLVRGVLHSGWVVNYEQAQMMVGF